MPAQAGIQEFKELDPGLRRDDELLCGLTEQELP
jgi:hypothetical protein